MRHAVPADQYQPALRWYSHLWRTLVCILISGAVWGMAGEGQWEQRRALFWLDLGVGLVAYVLVFLRRRWPLAIALATGALSVVSGVAAGPATLAAVSLATRRVSWQVALIGLVSVAAGVLYPEIMPAARTNSFLVNLVVNMVVTAAILGWGMYIGSRRELLWTLRDRADRAEAERDLRADTARAHERARIAREMHDVLAHKISQVSMLSGALAFRGDLSREQMRTSAGLVQIKANEALEDLRAVLGVLRDADGELLDTPQPTYGDLPALVDEARASGMQVEFDDLLALEGGRVDVPEGVGRTVYRIVQEGLTNARKHAPGAVVRIQLTGNPQDGVDVLVRNPIGFGSTAVTPGAGLGLVGLSERTELRGGRLEHCRDGSTFVLHGWIPWAA